MSLPDGVCQHCIRYLFFLLPPSLLHLSSKQFLGYVSTQLKIVQTDMMRVFAKNLCPFKLGFISQF